MGSELLCEKRRNVKIPLDVVFLHLPLESMEMFIVRNTLEFVILYVKRFYLLC